MPIEKKPGLSQSGEQAWLRFKQHLEWCDHFALGVFFSEHSAVVSIFRDRLADIHRARVTRLIMPVPDSPEQLINDILPELLNPAGYKTVLSQPFWIDLSTQTGENWTKARLSFLVRLNEQRESLRKSMKSPLILVLPLSEKANIKALVPDLWAIRDFSLETGPWLMPETGLKEQAVPKDQGFFPQSDYDRSMIKEWERIKGKKRLDRGMLLAGERACQAWMKTGRYKDAMQVALNIEKIARKLLKKNKETPESLRDLSVSLNNVGKTAVSQGDYGEGRVCFKESLEISRKILTRVGETPESLRDLSVSLDNVGNTAVSQGDYGEGQACFTEGLGIVKELARVFPGMEDYQQLESHFKDRITDLENKSF